jgi:Ca2+-binding RTX toxin-like protein
MTESASATIAATQLGPSSYQYTVTLDDTGSTTIGTFWFGWVPGEDFLDSSPSSVTAPAGWTDHITNMGSNDGFAIEWTASSPSSDLAPGGSLTGFSFISSESPSSLFGDSHFFPGTPELTSFVYSGAPFSDAGFQFVVEPMRQPPSPNFLVLDTTTNTRLPANGTAYSGPVAGLQSEYIYTGSDNLNVTATVPNVFIHTGSGEDAIDVSHANGNNVLDGSTGSNFLVGGTGDDTFFVDDRSPSADIWSTVANFHAGDAATIFGITQSGFNTSWVDGQGATGYTGLTLHVTGSGHPTASLTLAGFSTADLSNGRISTSWGTEADGTPYLYVHANTMSAAAEPMMNPAPGPMMNPYG